MKDPITIDYLAPIPAGGNSGRSKATREKAAALLRVSPGSRAFLLDQKYEGRPLQQLVAMLWLDVRYLLTTLFAKRVPDAIVSRSHLPFGALLVRGIRGIPVIREMHTDIADEAPVGFQGRPVKRTLFRLLHYPDVWSLRRSDGVIFNNTALERHVRERYLDEEAATTTVPNGTDTSTFRMLDRERCRADLELSPERRYLVWVGSINRWHGVDLVFQLADELPSGYEVLVVGNDQSLYARQLVRESSGRARVVGSVAPELAAWYMNAADACLLPVADLRVSPGSPLKLYDYAACGTPVIAQRDTEGYSDVTLQHGIGTVVDFRDPEGSAREIEEFLECGRPSRMDVRRVAEQEFAWEHRMGQWMQFVQRIRQPAR